MVAQVEFRKILRFRKPTGRGGSSRKKVHSVRAKYPESRKCNGVGGGGVIAEKSSLSVHVVAKLSKKKSVDSSINHFLVRRLKQVITDFFVDWPSNVLVFYSIHFLRSNISFVEI